MTDRDVIVMVPVIHAVVRHIDTTIVAKDHPPRVVRINPQRMVIHMDSASAVARECLPTIFGPVE